MIPVDRSLQSYYNQKHDWHQLHTEEEQEVKAKNALATGFHRYALEAAEIVSVDSSETSVEDSEFQPNDNENKVLVLDEVMLFKDQEGKTLANSNLI